MNVVNVYFCLLLNVTVFTAVHLASYVTKMLSSFQVYLTTFYRVEESGMYREDIYVKELASFITLPYCNFGTNGL